MCSPVRLLSLSKAPTSLHCMTGWIAALQHVLLARPEELHRRAGHLLGDQRRPGARSPGTRRAGRSRRRGGSCRPRTCRPAGRTPPAPPRTMPRRPASAPTPRTCRPCSARSRSSAPCRRGSGTDRRRPPRPSWRRAAIAALASPFWLPTKACSASRPSFSHCGDRGARDLGVRRPRPRRSAARRARSWPATRCRPPPRRRCRRPAPPS